MDKMNKREIADKSDLIERESVISNYRIKTYESTVNEIIEKHYNRHKSAIALETSKNENLKNKTEPLKGFVTVCNQELFLNELYQCLDANEFIKHTSYRNFRYAFSEKIPSQFKKIVWNKKQNVLHYLVKFLKMNEIIEDNHIWVATRNIFEDETGKALQLANSNFVSKSNLDFKKLYEKVINPLQKKFNL